MKSKITRTSCALFILCIALLFTASCRKDAANTNSQPSSDQPVASNPAIAPASSRPAPPTPKNAKVDGKFEYLEPKPLAQVTDQKLQPVQSGGKLPTITWGGDLITVHAKNSGLISNELTHNDNFVQAVNEALSGQTPYVRGTLGMINAANETFKQRGTELETIIQLSYSEGPDVLVVRDTIKRPSDLRGKKIALQYMGPHQEFLSVVARSAGVQPNELQAVFFRELSVPLYATGGLIVDPVTAFENDPSLDGVLCIIPDALRLTSNGAVGTGAEGSVKGSRILIRTKEANRVIADVIAVRKDYKDAHKDEVQKVVLGLLQGQEKLADLLKNKGSRKSELDSLIATAAKLFFQSDGAQAKADTEALIEGCGFAGLKQNIAFFTGKSTSGSDVGRNFNSMSQEIQASFAKLGLMSGSTPVRSAGWDYQALASSLKPEDGSDQPRYDRSALEQQVAKQIAVEPSKWEANALFPLEINFASEQTTFTVEQYRENFRVFAEYAETYGGALITIEGHVDPYGILVAKSQQQNPGLISQMEQRAKNLSLERAKAVKAAFLDYCRKNHKSIDESRIIEVGRGVESPKHGNPQNQQQSDENRRVVFSINRMELEPKH